jgi:hypothetical protein
VTPQLETIERALALVSQGSLGRPHALITVFGRLGAEVQVRAAVLAQQAVDPGTTAALSQLHRLFSYTSLRERDVFTRLSTIGYLRDLFSETQGDDAIPWYSIAALAIKDFHIDISALMDALAPVLIHATVGLKPKDLQKLPAFPDIQQGTQRSYRQALPDRVRELVDSTARWWPSAKRLRDVLAHREHEKVAFGHASSGVLVQVYEPGMVPLVAHPAFLWEPGNNVADFERYSAYLLAEVLVFMDDLGRELASALGWGIEGLNNSMLCGDFSAFLVGLQRTRESLLANALNDRGDR